MKKIIVLVALSISFIIQAVEIQEDAVAEKPKNLITGAFGINLGSFFNPKKSAIGKSALTSGEPMYQFNTKNKFRKFSEYYVLITPKTHKVYAIWAIARFEEKAEAIAEQDVVKSIIEKKYGKFKREAFSFNPTFVLESGSQSITTIVNMGFRNNSLEVRYNDSDLADLAKKEKLEIEASKTDTSSI